MKLSRNFTNAINWILDNLLPPIIRDNRLFARVIFTPLFGSKTKDFMNFKDHVLTLNENNLAKYYENLAEVHIQRETDLNTECIELILKNIVGKKILDIACGRGFLTKKIGEDKQRNVWGCDFVILQNLQNTDNVTFLKANIEKIPFEDKFFDTVICTHTLEHVLNIQRALSELRRIAKQRVIIVVPRQREYRYTFDLHVNFFPYTYSFVKIIGGSSDSLVSVVHNDIFYIENIR